MKWREALLITNTLTAQILVQQGFFCCYWMDYPTIHLSRMVLRITSLNQFRLVCEKTAALLWLHDNFAKLLHIDSWSCQVDWSETGFDFRVTSPLLGGLTADHLERFSATICCKHWEGRSHGAGTASASHGTVRTFFLATSFCFRCLSAGSCFFGKLSTVSFFNYVHFCCLLLHAVTGPLCVPDLLCNMARKYLRFIQVYIYILDLSSSLSCIW